MTAFSAQYPGIAAAVNTTSTIAVDMNALAADDEASRVVLEGDRIRVVPPVGEVIGELDGIFSPSFAFQCRTRTRGRCASHYLPEAPPLDGDIVATGFNLVAM